MVTNKSTAEEVSFEWSHHRIWLTDPKVRTTLRLMGIYTKNTITGIPHKCLLVVTHDLLEGNCYSIVQNKWIPFSHVCSVTDHRRHRHVVRTSVTHTF